MKNIKNRLMISLITLGTMASFLPVSAVTPTDAELKSMLEITLIDEYKAEAEYTALIEEFGSVRPISQIAKAEAKHIIALENLFDLYDFTLPENLGETFAVIPASLIESYAIGVEAEVYNISLYENYLQQDLPDEVERVFTNLMEASENHLDAFEKALDQDTGLANPVQDGSFKPIDTGRTNASNSRR